MLRRLRRCAETPLRAVHYLSMSESIFKSHVERAALLTHLSGLPSPHAQDVFHKKFEESKHPRGRDGRFISTGDIVDIAGGGHGEVTGVGSNGQVKVKLDSGKTETVDAKSLSQSAEAPKTPQEVKREVKEAEAQVKEKQKELSANMAAQKKAIESGDWQKADQLFLEGSRIHDQLLDARGKLVELGEADKNEPLAEAPDLSPVEGDDLTQTPVDPLPKADMPELSEGLEPVEVAGLDITSLSDEELDSKEELAMGLKDLNPDLAMETIQAIQAERERRRAGGAGARA